MVVPKDRGNYGEAHAKIIGIGTKDREDGSKGELWWIGEEGDEKNKAKYDAFWYKDSSKKTPFDIRELKCCKAGEHKNRQRELNNKHIQTSSFFGSNYLKMKNKF